MKASRRHFLQAAASLAGAAPGCARGATPLALGLAGLSALASHAATRPGSEYRALVCVFLRGGSDGHNWVVPTDPDGHAAYQRARGQLAVPLRELHRLARARSQAPGRTFGMAGPLAPLHALYERGEAALVANVGPMARPLTRAEALAGHHLPTVAGAHDEQAVAWQCLSADATGPGWGGRMGDILMSANAQPVFTMISSTGEPLFLCGDAARPLRVGENGPLERRAMAARDLAGLALDPDPAALLRASLQRDGVPGLPTAPIALPGEGRPHRFSLSADSLARQLATVTRIIDARVELGARRQVFMVSIGGFDTHQAQAQAEPELMARLAHAVNWFHGAMNGLGLSQQVTLFTASEFGRTLVPEGDGTDHGWGNHHFIVGGGLEGSDIVGRFPEAGVGSEEDLGSGRLLPTTSVTQLAATLGRWMGLSDTDLLDVLPGLDAFASRTLPLFPVRTTDAAASTLDRRPAGPREPAA